MWLITKLNQFETKIICKFVLLHNKLLIIDNFFFYIVTCIIGTHTSSYYISAPIITQHQLIIYLTFFDSWSIELANVLMFAESFFYGKGCLFI